MNIITLKLRSSIKPALHRYVLFRGTSLAFIGAILLLYHGIFVRAEELGSYGFLVITLGIGLIALGLLPYRRLTKLEKEPHEIWIIEDSSVCFRSRGKNIVSIPLNMIKKVEHLDEGREYGIALSMQPSFLDGRELQQISKKSKGCDLFLPYFTKRSFDELQNHLDDTVND